MTAYAPNFTPRLRVRYRAALGAHTQTWRFPSLGVLSAGLLAAIVAVQSFYDALADAMYDDWQILSVSYADVDQDVFVPTTGLSVLGTIATPTDNPGIKASAISFVGRATDGQPAKIAQFGFADAIGGSSQRNDYRINPGENPLIDAAIDVLQSSSIGVLCGSSGANISWYEYANAKDYDYWVKRVRTGS